MAEKKVAIDVVLNARGAAKSLGDLRQASEDLAQALESQELGSKAFKSLSSEIAVTNKEIKNLELGFEALSNEQQASELGSVAGAVGDITTAFVLLGGENETMQQIASSIQTAMGVTMAFKGAIEGVSSARKLLNSLDKQSTIIKIKDAIVTKTAAAAQALYAFAIGTSTGALKLFRIALAATGIGLLIIGIGLLIANFDKVTKAVSSFVDYLLDLAMAFAPILFLMELFTGKTKEQREEESKAAKERREQNAELGRQTAERLKAIKDVRAAEKKAHEKRLTQYDLQIARLEAQGKSSFAVRIQMLEDILSEKNASLEASNAMLAEWTNYYTQRAILSGQDLDDFKASLKKQGVDLDALQEQVLDQQQVLKDAIFSAETEITALKRTESEKQSAITKTAAAEDQKVKDAVDKLNEAARVSRLNAQEKEVDAVGLKYDELIKLAKKNNIDTTQLEESKQLELSNINQKYIDKERLQNEKEADELFKLKTGISKRLADFEKDEFQLKLDELAAQYEAEKLLFIDNEEALLLLDEEYKTKKDEIEQEASEADKAKAKEDRAQKLADAQEQAQALIGIAQSFHDIASTISELANSKELNRIKKKQDAGEKLSKDEIKLLIKAEKTKRALAVSQIAIDTATSIASVIAGATSAAATTGPAAPFVLAGYIASGIATVLGSMASASKILSAPMPDFQTPASTNPDEDRDEDEDLDAPDTDLFNTGSTLLNEGMGKVYVLEQDITDTQNNVASIKDQATFG